MTLILNCMFGDGPQTYWIASATAAELQNVRNAMAGPAGDVVSIMARASEMGADHERLIRAGAIQCINIDRD